MTAVESGRTSWTGILDVRRLGPTESETEMTAEQLRTVVEGIIVGGHWKTGDPKILVLFDAGYNVARIAWLLSDLPLEVIGRLRSDRVLCIEPAPSSSTSVRLARHGLEFKLQDPDTWGTPATENHTQTTRYGDAAGQSWNRLHPRLTRRSAREERQGQLLVIPGTLIRLEVQRLQGNAKPKPPWNSALDLDTAGADRYWQSYLRSFELEHTFRFLIADPGLERPAHRIPSGR